MKRFFVALSAALVAALALTQVQAVAPTIDHVTLYGSTQGTPAEVVWYEETVQIGAHPVGSVAFTLSVDRATILGITNPQGTTPGLACDSDAHSVQCVVTAVHPHETVTVNVEELLPGYSSTVTNSLQAQATAGDYASTFLQTLVATPPAAPTASQTGGVWLTATFWIEPPTDPCYWYPTALACYPPYRR